MFANRQTGLKKIPNKYTSPEIQNEMLQIMALNILQKNAANIQDTSYFTLMTDESTDSSNKEQFVTG